MSAAEKMDRGDWILTHTGRHFYALDPRPEDICIEDIAQALSLTCRFGGHCNEFYSVAQHSVLVSELVPANCALAALLHDASEAYITDVPRPIKRGWTQYELMEDHIMRAVAEKFGFEYPLPEPVENIDHRIVADEAIVLWDRPPIWTRDYELVGIDVEPVGPFTAKAMFLHRYYELVGETNE